MTIIQSLTATPLAVWFLLSKSHSESTQIPRLPWQPFYSNTQNQTFPLSLMSSTSGFASFYISELLLYQSGFCYTHKLEKVTRDFYVHGVMFLGTLMAKLDELAVC